MRKGQAAMEFLMTYGWAILVVIAAIAALAYFGVLDPARLLPERCQSSAGMDCVDKASITTTQIDFALQNNVAFDILVQNATITGITCTGSSASAGTSGAYTALDGSNNVTVSNNEVVRVRYSGCSGVNSGSKFEGTATVRYVNTNTGLPHPVTVDIRGSVAQP
ncbi:MAG: hypothetical protein ABIJ34_00415 [archaeon]